MDPAMPDDLSILENQSSPNGCAIAAERARPGLIVLYSNHQPCAEVLELEDTRLTLGHRGATARCGAGAAAGAAPVHRDPPRAAHAGEQRAAAPRSIFPYRHATGLSAAAARAADRHPIHYCGGGGARCLSARARLLRGGMSTATLAPPRGSQVRRENWPTDAENHRPVKWDGATWALQASGTEAALYAIRGTDVNNLWTVGNTETILNWHPQLPISCTLQDGRWCDGRYTGTFLASLRR